MDNNEISQSDSDSEIVGKKRKRCPSQWKRNVSKLARLKGEEYKDYKGQTRPALSVGEPCRCQHFKCFENISEEDATDIFNRVHDFGSKNEQDIYIQSLIQVNKVARRRSRKENPRNVENSFSYFAIVGNTRMQVCFKAFIALHGTTENKVKRLRKLAAQGLNAEDKRGKGPSANTIPPETRELIRNHIESFPQKISHYSGKSKIYLDSRLSVAAMFRLFKEKHPIVKVSSQFFTEYFNNNYSLSFGRPQVDCCSTCEELKVKLKSPHLNENAKRVAAAELLVHKRKSKKFYDSLKHEAESKDEPHVLSLCFDFMQNIPLPQIPVQETFYLRQLTLNVFCIHNIKDKTSNIYLYHEGTANKGPNEVCSFIYDYLHTTDTSKLTELRLFSDNCGGQNKNHALSRFLLALTETGKFTTVQQFFPIRGHSFLPCDRDFATIKRQLRRHDRLYSVEEIRTLIIQSSKPGKFIVKEVETSEILDFKSWWSKYYKKNCISEETRSRDIPKDRKVPSVHFGISSQMHFLFKKELPGTIICSTNINSLIKHTFRFSHNVKLKPELPPPKAYAEDKVPIKLAKITDLKKLLPYVPEEHKEFYDELVQWPTTERDIDPTVQDG